MSSFVCMSHFLQREDHRTEACDMDNINKTAYNNNKYLANNSSWDLQIIPMEDHHMNLQIPPSHNIPLFPNYPLPYSSSSSSSSSSPCLIDHLPSSNSTLFLPTTTTIELLSDQQDHHHHHDQEDDHGDDDVEEKEEEEELGAMKEMMYKIAAMQPVDIDPATIQRPRRRNVRISDDPQSVAARLRRERISERMRILQRLVPGGTKMDTASMLDEAIRYVKFLKRQIRLLAQSNTNNIFITANTNKNNHHLIVSPHYQPCPPELGINIISSNNTTNIINNNIINWGLDKFVPNYKLGHAHNPSTAGSASSLFAFTGGRSSNGGFGEA